MMVETWLHTVPDLPAELNLAGKRFIVQRVLRHLRGRRITVKANDEQEEVVLKLFAVKGKGAREFAQELQAYEHCNNANIAVAPVLAYGTESSTLNYICYRYIANATTLAELDDSQQPLQQLFSLFAACHTANCYQHDPHRDNFIYDGKTVFLLDLGSVRCQNKALSLALCLDNLAVLISQWPVEQEARLMSALNTYFEQRGMVFTSANQRVFARKLKQARRQRQRHYLKKQLRSCTMTHYQRSSGYELACRRDFAPALMPAPLAQIQQHMAAGVILKNGNTATVASAMLADKNVVIKRYNIKNIRHFLGRCWRPSRARNSWLMANLLEYVGISTPPPLAFIEQRMLGLRAKAFFICEHIAGRTLNDVSEHELAAPALLQQLAELFSQLRCHHLYHGDLKATNFIVDAMGKVWLIDLDSMKICAENGFAELHQLDQQRFLRNWSEQQHQLLSDAIQA